MSTPPIAGFPRDRQPRPRLSVSIAAADPGWLARDSAMLADAGATMVHVDIADGVHSPLFTFGPSVLAGPDVRLVRDVHLLVAEPLDHIDAAIAAGADGVTFQLEACRRPYRVLQRLTGRTGRDPGRQLVRGVGIGLGTPLEVLEPLLGLVDHVVVLAIEPGASDTVWPDHLERRVAAVRAMIDIEPRPVTLGLDGGVTIATAPRGAAMSVDIIVAGSAIFRATDPVRALHEVQAILDGGRLPSSPTP